VAVPHGSGGRHYNKMVPVHTSQDTSLYNTQRQIVPTMLKRMLHHRNKSIIKRATSSRTEKEQGSIAIPSVTLQNHNSLKEDKVVLFKLCLMGL